MHPDLVPVPDDLPRDGLFAQPLTISLRVSDPEPGLEGGTRVTFRVGVRDAEGRRCPDLAVSATIDGPHRTAAGMGHTDLMGTVRFRMNGPPGRYRITIDDVAGGALALDRDVSVLATCVDVV
jgi:hypothetical protein